jgi:hypothetical protein
MPNGYQRNPLAHPLVNRVPAPRSDLGSDGVRLYVEFFAADFAPLGRDTFKTSNIAAFS